MAAVTPWLTCREDGRVSSNQIPAMPLPRGFGSCSVCLADAQYTTVAVKGFLDTRLVVMNSVRRPAVEPRRSSRGAAAQAI